VNVLKCDIGDVDETMFHDVERTFERIFFISGIKKSIFREVDSVMFYLSEWPWEHIVCILGVLKTALVKSMMRCKNAIGINFCILSIEKCDLVEVA
jgi:hypothetical protein